MKKTILKVFLIFVGLSTIIAFRVFIFNIYKIPSASMSPAILTEDYVLVNKLSYGPRMLNVAKLIFSGEAEYIRIKGFEHVKKNDVVVFNFPEYEYLSDSGTFIYGSLLIKRCLGIPGDSIRIRENGSEIFKTGNYNSNFFPNDTSLHWILVNFGPMYVPGKEDTMVLTHENVRYYHDVLFYENNEMTIRNDSVFIGSYYNEKHNFKYNYYFMLGDNFYRSRDSRFWGFLPETHIIGKAVLVLFSIDPEAPCDKKFRWKWF